MKTWVRTTLRAGVLAAGFLLFATSPAQAADQTSGNNSGIGNGNNISVPIAAAGTACGNGVGIFGGGAGMSGACKTTAVTKDGGSQTSGDNSGIGNGNNVSVPISLAATACGNGGGGAGGGLGISGACHTTAKTGEHGGYGESQTSGDNTGALNGNNVRVPISGALTVCGNGVGIFGGGLGISGACKTSAAVNAGGEGSQTSGDNSGLGVGNNWSSPIALAGTFCGNGGGGAGIGVGISGACSTDASVNEGDHVAKLDADGPGVKAAKKALKTAGVTKNEELPTVSAPMPAPAVGLPSPVNELTAPVLGAAGDATSTLPALG